MANASKNSMGSGTHGKGSGAGAMDELPEDMLEENMVLSNRDKAQHSDARGLDSRAVQTDQYQDNPANRTIDPKSVMQGDGNTTGNKGARSNVSGNDSSLKSQR